MCYNNINTIIYTLISIINTIDSDRIDCNTGK